MASRAAGSWCRSADGSAGPEPEVDVSVRDFGPGIAEEHIPRITESFYRVDVEPAGQKGTGLGLAIVKHILTRHQARLVDKVRSRARERPLRFIFAASAEPLSKQVQFRRELRKKWYDAFLFSVISLISARMKAAGAELRRQTIES